MKALEWKNWLDDQERRFDKRVFTTTELSHVAGRRAQRLNGELVRLRKAGVLARVARGVYSAPGRAGPEDVVPWMDETAYVTGASALAAAGVITQQPAEVLCFTLHRHFRELRRTSVGSIRFLRVAPPLYARPAAGVRAEPAQALCDLLWIQWREQTDPASLYSFRRLDAIPRAALRAHLRRYPPPVAVLAKELLRRHGPAPVRGVGKKHRTSNIEH